MALAIVNGASAKLDQLRGDANGVSARGIDRDAQEDAREITISGGSTLAITGTIDSTAAFRIAYSLDDRPLAPVALSLGTAAQGARSNVDITQTLSVAAGKGWREMVITQACAAGGGSTIAITPDQSLSIRISSITREELPEGTECSL